MDFFSIKSNWIWTAAPACGTSPEFVLFRHTFNLPAVQTLAIDISADSRYQLFFNGTRIADGPCRGNQSSWYYDSIKVQAQEGMNCIAVRVLRYPQGCTDNPGVWRSPMPGLWVKVWEKDTTDQVLVDASSEDWKYLVEEGHVLTARDPMDTLKIGEKLGPGRPVGWEQTDYDDTDWACACARPEFSLDKSRIPVSLTKRPIPMQFYEDTAFAHVVCVREGSLVQEAWEAFLQGGELIIPPHTKVCAELDAGREVTGYLHADLEGGDASHIRILSAECYSYENTEGGFFGEGSPAYPIKKDRTDYRNGRLDGLTDEIEVTGQKEHIETYFYRAFRYLRLEIDTGDAPLKISKFGYRKTGYPLEVKTDIHTSDPSLERIWEISLQALRCCMQDTYIDCPFYEQLQYIQDSRLEALFTYATAADDRMARRTLADFAASQRPDGLLYGCYPSMTGPLIPGFSLYFVNMVHDHMMYFADRDLVECYLPTIMKIYHFFEEDLDERGLVKSLTNGGFGQKYWDFVDWADGWDAGVPQAAQSGALSFYTLQLCLAYREGAELARFLGYQDLESSWNRKADLLVKAVQRYCLDENGIPLDGPDFPAYSQHVLSLAVLADVSEDPKKLMRFALEDASVTKCTVSNMFPLFRALEKADMYEYTDSLWNIWRQMVKDNLTTCAETDKNARSDCHAWSALALYEIPAVILGIRPEKPGFADFRPTPAKKYLKEASGNVITPIGTIKVSV